MRRPVRSGYRGAQGMRRHAIAMTWLTILAAALAVLAARNPALFA